MARCLPDQGFVTSKDDELFSLSLSTLLPLLEQGEIHHEAYLQSILQRIEQCKHLNIFTAYDEAIIARQLGGLKDGLSLLPLHGVPFAVKDNILTEDYPTSNGTPALKDWQPGVDAEIVKQTRRLGGVLLGKLNMSEFCQHISCNNVTFGPVRNPHNPDMIPGGSSGACAAGVAAGLFPFAIGTDTGGSVRIPAALCGCCGYRPTTGRFSNTGITPVAPIADTPGLLTRSVADIILLDQLLTGAADSDPIHLSGLRLGIPRTYFYDELDPDISNAMETAFATLSAHGVILVEHDMPDLAELIPRVGMPIVFYSMLREISFFLLRHGNLTPVRSIIEQVAGEVEKTTLFSQLNELLVSADSYHDALCNKLPALRRKYDDYFHESNSDVFLVPTTIAPAKPHSANGTDREIDHLQQKRPSFLSYIHNTEPSSFAGVPCVSIPVGLTGTDLPVGMEIVGQRGYDARLLQIAVAIEAILPRFPNQT